MIINLYGIFKIINYFVCKIICEGIKVECFLVFRVIVIYNIVCKI